MWTQKQPEACSTANKLGYPQNQAFLNKQYLTVGCAVPLFPPSAPCFKLKLGLATVTDWLDHTDCRPCQVERCREVLADGYQLWRCKSKELLVSSEGKVGASNERGVHVLVRDYIYWLSNRAC